MKATTIAYSSFAVLTSLYFVAKDFRAQKNKGSSDIFMIYFLLVIGIQSIINLRILTENECKSPASMSFYLGVGIFYWIAIFLLTTFLIESFTGWKTAFSNTFGYMVIILFGIRQKIDIFFNEIMNNYKQDDKRDIFSMIYRDRSLILNELTPTNIHNLVEVMIGTTSYSDIINNKIQSEYTYKKVITPNQESALRSIEVLLHRKDSVASFVWYALAGTVTISFIHMLLVRPKCDVSYNDVKRTAELGYKRTIQDTGVEDFTKDKAKEAYDGVSK